jgi:hypothetical protein
MPTAPAVFYQNTDSGKKNSIECMYRGSLKFSHILIWVPEGRTLKVIICPFSSGPIDV